MPSILVEIKDAPVHTQQNFRLTVEQGLGRQAKRCSGELWIEGGSNPLAGQEITITLDGSLEFGGILTRLSDVLFNPDVHKITFDAVDYSIWLDAKLVTTEREEELLSVRVQGLLDEYAPAFSVGDIDVDEEVPAQSIDYRKLSSVFDELAESTGQYFELKFDKTVNFLTVGDPAPISDLSTDNLDMGDLSTAEDWSDLSNVLVIRDFTMRSAYSITDDFVVEGVQSFFPLSYPPWNTEETVVEVKYGSDPWETRTSVLDPLGTQSEYEIYRPEGGDPEEETEEHEEARLEDLEAERASLIEGNTGEAYICLWNEGIRFPQCDLPEDGSVVRVIYPFERREQVLRSEDLSSIEEMASRSGTDGVFEKTISLPALRAINLKSATDYTEMLLARSAWPSVTCSFNTYIKGWKPGQQCSLEGISVWVNKVIKTIKGIEHSEDEFKVYHEVSCTNRPRSVPIPLDEFLHRLMEQTQRITPPGNPPSLPEPTTTTTLVSSTTTTLVSSTTTTLALSTTTTRLPFVLLATKYTELLFADD